MIRWVAASNDGPEIWISLERLLGQPKAIPKIAVEIKRRHQYVWNFWRFLQRLQSDFRPFEPSQRHRRQFVIDHERQKLGEFLPFDEPQNLICRASLPRLSFHM